MIGGVVQVEPCAPLIAVIVPPERWYHWYVSCVPPASTVSVPLVPFVSAPPTGSLPMVGATLMVAALLSAVPQRPVMRTHFIRRAIT